MQEKSSQTVRDRHLHMSFREREREIKCHYVTGGGGKEERRDDERREDRTGRGGEKTGRRG